MKKIKIIFSFLFSISLTLNATTKPAVETLTQAFNGHVEKSKDFPSLIKSLKFPAEFEKQALEWVSKKSGPNLSLPLPRIRFDESSDHLFISDSTGRMEVQLLSEKPFIVRVNKKILRYEGKQDWQELVNFFEKNLNAGKTAQLMSLLLPDAAAKAEKTFTPGFIIALSLIAGIALWGIFAPSFRTSWFSSEKKATKAEREVEAFKDITEATEPSMWGGGSKIQYPQCTESNSFSFSNSKGHFEFSYAGGRLHELYFQERGKSEKCHLYFYKSGNKKAGKCGGIESYEDVEDMVGEDLLKSHLLCCKSDPCNEKLNAAFRATRFPGAAEDLDKPGSSDDTSDIAE